MTDEIGTYTFLPWLREGMTNSVTTPTDPTAKRGRITVSLKIDGKGVDGGADVSSTVDKTIELYGPGDIVGIESKAILKTEPRNWITNFEPNYLPYVEFADPDFLWRYTPSAATGDRLIPWLTLIVLREEEFTDGKNIINRPLHYIQLGDDINLETTLPPKSDLWAWGHVHVNKDIVGTRDNPVSTDENTFIVQLKNSINSNSDLAYCRLLSSRKLAENTPYHVFVIPTFEAGRRAGLRLDPSANLNYGANTISWEDYAGREEPKNFPIYHRWYFRTGNVGDFEYFVRLLKPKLADSRVGHRDIDVLEPGSSINGITDDRLKGILRLGGALQFPKNCLTDVQEDEYNNYDVWYDSYPHRFHEELAAFINLADDYKRLNTTTAHNESDLTIENGEDDPDPLITPPFYARWHAMMTRILKNESGGALPNNNNWVHELNLDPRWRTVANFGTQVVQQNQETYMDAAWGQAGDILKANRKFDFGKLAGLASKVWYRKSIVPRPNVALEKIIFRTTPLHKRILSGGTTIAYAMQTSIVPHALVSAPMRRVIRPRGKLIKQMVFSDAARIDNLLTRVNQRKVSPAPPRNVPKGVLTLEKLAEVARPDYAPKFLVQLINRYPWLQYLPFVLVLIIIFLLFFTGVVSSFASTTVLAVAAIGAALFLGLRKLLNDTREADSIRPDNQKPESVDNIPKSPNFRVTEFGDSFRPSVGTMDSAEATRFKTALRQSFDFVNRSAIAGAVPIYTPLNIPAVVNDTVAALNPAVTIPRYLLGHIALPPHIVDALRENFVDVMAYPVIDLPMYQPLLATGTDNFVPNLNLIEQNSITLLQTNQRFIESYMVGINHEFVRELQWREFPTDLRATCFRQFWDVSGVINKDDLDDETLRERLRDIPPLHRWSKYSKLGDHDQREIQGDKEEEVVLVIRGELLKKYPTAVIYAHKAKWVANNEGERDLTKPREFQDEGDPLEYIKTPLYQAKADPDIYFLGFDLTVTEAKGDSGEEADDEAGWFFVIKERPGEPRFGLDVPGETGDYTQATVEQWNELAWSHIIENVTADKYLSVSGSRAISVHHPAAPQPEEGEARDAWRQKKEDAHIAWNSSTNSAELAYILYQVPVLIGVHSAEMLPDDCGNKRGNQA